MRQKNQVHENQLNPEKFFLTNFDDFEEDKDVNDQSPNSPNSKPNSKKDSPMDLKKKKKLMKLRISMVKKKWKFIKRN